MDLKNDHENAFQIFSLKDEDASARSYKRRKFHSKSNCGCLSCKAKKVKCDEIKPVCTRCRRNDRPCLYSQSKKDDQGFSLVKSFSFLTPMITTSFPAPSAKNGTSSGHLVQHLATHWIEIFDVPQKETIFELSKNHSFLRNTILAITASHLRHLSNGIIHHRIAEHFQQSLALRDYQMALYMGPASLGQSGVDALLLNAMLLNILAFTLPENGQNSNNGDVDSSTSWVFHPQKDQLDWLALQGGFGPLLKATSAYLEQTLGFLGPIFLGPNFGRWEAERKASSLNVVPQNWIIFFGLEDEDIAGGNSISKKSQPKTHIHVQNVYGQLVNVLAQLKNMDPGRTNVFRYFSFLAKISPRYRALLYDRDEKALWLLGYWLGLMSRFEGLWWCRQRVKRDYRAICLWLYQAGVGTGSDFDGEIGIEMIRELESVPFEY